MASPSGGIDDRSSSSSDGIDAHVFQLVSSSALRGLLDKIVGNKTLVLEPSLAGPLGLVTEVSSLKNNHGVSKMFWLEPGALAQAERNVVYLCRPELRWIKIIADQIKLAPSSSSHHYHLLVVPRLTQPCLSLLSDLGVLGSLDIQEFQLGLIPLESDLLSLELDDAYRKMELEQDHSVVWDMAKALMVVQRAFGDVPRIIGKGEGAKRLADVLQRLRREMPHTNGSGGSTPTPPLATNASIDSMIILDRSVDLVTPMCTQLTYEGLIDEVIGIKNSHVDVDPSLLNPSPSASTSSPSQSSGLSAQSPSKPKKHLLSSSSDPLFAELRDANFAVVGSILNRVARRLNDDYERRHQAKTPAELRMFVGQLGGLQSEHQALRLHTGLTEKVMGVTGGDEFNVCLEVQQNLVAGVDLATQESTIRDLINREAPLYTVLRLLCLYSLVSGGLILKVLEALKKEILQTYGHSHLSLLTHLGTLSLLTRPPPSLSSASKSPFSLSRKPLRLIVDDVDEQKPSDISYVFSGYAPLSVRLVQCAIGASGGRGGVVNGWKGVEEVVRALGPHPSAGRSEDMFDRSIDLPTSSANGIESSGASKTTLVVYLGGITYAEVAALRFAQRGMRGRNLLIVTTSCVQGTALLRSLQPAPMRSSSAA